MEMCSKRAPGSAKKIAEAALENNMLLLTAGAFETVRVIPPLTVSKEEIDLGLQILGKACEKVFK
jgi:4-aminobutyrate aminotransferase